MIPSPILFLIIYTFPSLKEVTIKLNVQVVFRIKMLLENYGMKYFM